MDESKNQPASPAPDPIRPDNPLFEKLGSCCECGTREAVHNIIFLNRKCVIRGHGWGCHICGLPPDGAVIVFCKSCMQRFEAGLIKIRLACKGYPMEYGRVPIEQLTEPHEHNHRIHRLYEDSFKSLN